MTNWFSADLHLGHKNIIEYCKRPFKDVEEMNGVITKNFIEKIKEGDTLYLLGDLSFNSQIIYRFLSNFQRINLHYITGNHDRKETLDTIKNHPITKSIYTMKNISVENIRITLCHYPMLRWYKSHFGSWNLFGHVHGRLNNKTIGKQYDVGVDNNNFMPISFQEIITIMKRQKDNEDLIEEK